MCDAPNCIRASILLKDGHSVCHKHYKQLWRNGEFHDGYRPRAKQSLDLRLQRNSRRLDNGCVVWTGTKTHNGYGQIKVDGKLVLAHRVSFEQHYGHVSPGMVIDHVCRTRDCINPHHLREITFKENVLAGVSFAAENAKKTHCVNGHEYSPDNTIIRTSGNRACRQCQREAGARYYSRKKASA